MRAIALATLVGFLGLTGPSFAQESDVLKRLMSADAEAGKNLALVCGACHTLDAGGGMRVGPNLYNLINRSVASIPGFQYSEALTNYAGDWSPERLDSYLENPAQTVPGTLMGFAGVSDAQDRANLIAHLNTLSDSPLASIGQDAGSTEAPSTPKDFGQLVAGTGVETTFYSCTSCHSEMIVAQQGKTREGWDELLVWMVEEQGMNEPTETDRNLILDYLAEHYNTDRRNFPR